ncbi:MAG: hypothetical protein ACI9B8_002453 [Sulfitobacter sp.]|jgi:hypothetical protein
MKKILLLLLALSFSIPFACLATTISSVTVSALANQSQLVFDGEVQSVEAFWRDERIHTRVTFSVLEVVAGDYEKKSIELIFAGGTKDGKRFSVGAEIPKMGERGIYFVESLEVPLLNPLYGWSQGHFVIENGQVYAADRAPVVQVEPTTKTTDLISDNVADGIYTTKRAPSIRVLTVDEFKSQIRGLTID